MFCQSSLQIHSGHVRLDGDCSFRSLQRCLIGLKSRFSLGHSGIFTKSCPVWRSWGLWSSFSLISFVFLLHSAFLLPWLVHQSLLLEKHPYILELRNLFLKSPLVVVIIFFPANFKQAFMCQTLRRTFCLVTQPYSSYQSWLFQISSTLQIWRPVSWKPLMQIYVCVFLLWYAYSPVRPYIGRCVFF